MTKAPRDFLDEFIAERTAKNLEFAASSTPRSSVAASARSGQELAGRRRSRHRPCVVTRRRRREQGRPDRVQSHEHQSSAGEISVQGPAADTAGVRPGQMPDDVADEFDEWFRGNGAGLDLENPLLERILEIQSGSARASHTRIPVPP